MYLLHLTSFSKLDNIMYRTLYVYECNAWWTFQVQPFIKIIISVYHKSPSTSAKFTLVVPDELKKTQDLKGSSAGVFPMKSSLIKCDESNIFSLQFHWLTLGRWIGCDNDFWNSEKQYDSKTFCLQFWN